MKQLLLCLVFTSFIAGSMVSCKDDESINPVVSTPKLIFKFVFDSTQARLDNIGNPSVLPSNHGAQSPRFNKMSAHYIELAPGPYTLLGDGEVVFLNQETNLGGSTAIDFSKSYPAGNGQPFFAIPISQLTPGIYKWLRVSLAYQNYDIDFRYTLNNVNYDLSGTLASFIGYNSYVSTYNIKDSTVSVNANRLQGYWAFETLYNVSQGQAPPGATTVPNPLFNTSPIPQGSCVVTSEFTTPLSITGTESSDIVVTVSLSTNKSFEWVEHSTPGYFEPAAGDTVVDMGVRGMVVGF